MIINFLGRHDFLLLPAEVGPLRLQSTFTVLLQCALAGVDLIFSWVARTCVLHFYFILLQVCHANIYHENYFTTKFMTSDNERCYDWKLGKKRLEMVDVFYLVFNLTPTLAPPIFQCLP
jgi:hypothetical protein